MWNGENHMVMDECWIDYEEKTRRWEERMDYEAELADAMQDEMVEDEEPYDAV